jgi:hypothetical protein
VGLGANRVLIIIGSGSSRIKAHFVMEKRDGNVGKKMPPRCEAAFYH